MQSGLAGSGRSIPRQTPKKVRPHIRGVKTDYKSTFSHARIKYARAFSLTACFVSIVSFHLLNKVTSLLTNLSRARQVLRTLDKYAATYYLYRKFKNSLIMETKTITVQLSLNDAYEVCRALRKEQTEQLDDIANYIYNKYYMYTYESYEYENL